MSKNRKVIFLRKENGDGQGEFYYPDGSKYVGECKDDKPWNGTGYDKNGKINVIFANGVQK